MHWFEISTIEKSKILWLAEKLKANFVLYPIIYSNSKELTRKSTVASHIASRRGKKISLKPP